MHSTSLIFLEYWHELVYHRLNSTSSEAESQLRDVIAAKKQSAGSEINGGEDEKLHHGQTHEDGQTRRDSGHSSVIERLSTRRSPTHFLFFHVLSSSLFQLAMSFIAYSLKLIVTLTQPMVSTVLCIHVS